MYIRKFSFVSLPLLAVLALSGTAHADLTIGSLLPNHVYGAPGPDTVNGGNDAQAVMGDDVGTMIFVPAFGISLPGISGQATSNDVVHGNNGDDQLFGENAVLKNNKDVAVGNDILNGNNGDDVVLGDAFNMGDFITNEGAKGGNDTISGSNGYDVVAGEAVQVYDTVCGNDTLYGGNDDDWLFGDAEFAFYDFSGGGQSIAGSDILDGGKGNELLMGDVRPPAFYGEIPWGKYKLDPYIFPFPADNITGANDKFVYDMQNDNGNDRILDFNWKNVPDTIVLKNVGTAEVNSLVSVQNDQGRAKLVFTRSDNSQPAGSVILDSVPYNGSNISSYNNIQIITD